MNLRPDDASQVTFQSGAAPATSGLRSEGQDPCPTRFTAVIKASCAKRSTQRGEFRCLPGHSMVQPSDRRMINADWLPRRHREGGASRPTVTAPSVHQNWHRSSKLPDIAHYPRQNGSVSRLIRLPEF